MAGAVPDRDGRITPFRSVVAYVTQGVSMFAMSAMSNVFADRTHLGLPRFEFSMCAAAPGSVRSDLGPVVEVRHGPEAMGGADLIILLPTGARPLTLEAPVAHALRAAHARGAIVAAYDTGTFLLAETGLLRGRRAATTWDLAEELARLHPGTRVQPDALYVDEGRVVTGAAAAAGIDMCLHLLRREHGEAVCNAVAREAMVALRHGSGQVRHFPSPSEGFGRPRRADEDSRLAQALAWTRARLEQPWSVEDMARQALMSPRTFARRFREATGTTPYAWLREQRLDRAEELLRTTDLPIQEIAQQAGFGSDGVMRDFFVRRHGISPRVYRRRFGPARLYEDPPDPIASSA